MNDYHGLGAAIVGKPIASVELDKAADRLTFALADGGKVVYTVDADCCSSSWIEHLTVPPDIAGAVVTAVKDDYGMEATEEQYAQSRADHDYIDDLKVYQTSFVTDRGEIVVEFRNNSNGYYGGWMTVAEAA